MSGRGGDPRDYGGSFADWQNHVNSGGGGGLQGYELVKQRELESAAAYEAQKRREAAEAAKQRAYTSSLQGILEASYGSAPVTQVSKYYDFDGGMNAQGYADLFSDLSLLSGIGGNVSDAGQISSVASFREDYGKDFKKENVLKLTGDVSGDFAGGNFTGMLAYDIPDDFGATALNLVAPKAVSAGASIAAGETAFNLAGLDPKTSAQIAMATDVGLKGILSASKVANTVQLADGTVGYMTNFGGKQAFTTRDAVTERNKALALEMVNQPEDDAGRAITESLGQGLSMVAQTGQRKPDWTDYYKPSFGFDPDEFVMDMIGGTLSQSDLKSVQLAGRISSGEDLVSAAVGVYGDAVRELLPEGYEKPTEAAIRIGMGENRVKVFGDVYGADFNLDNPLGKAGLKGAEVYDMTGDGDKALQDSIYTYFKEGGKLPDFEVPSFLPEDIDLDFDFPKLKMAGLSLKDMYDFGVDMPSLNLDWATISGEGVSFGELPELGFDLKKIDFGGTKLGDIKGLNLDNLGDYGLDIGDLPSMNIDFSFDLKMRKRKQLESLEDEEEFVSLEEDEDLLDPTRSLARELLGMEQTKSVQQAQENA